MREASKKVQYTASVDRDTMAWVDERIRNKEFSSRSHTTEFALDQLRIERTGQMSSWPAAEVRLMANPTGRLEGWGDYPETSRFFSATWHKTIDKFDVFLEADESRSRLAISIEQKGEVIGTGRFSLLAQQWFGPHPTGIDTKNAWTLEDFAKRVETYIESLSEAARQKSDGVSRTNEPIELEGWTRSPGFDNCDGYDFPYVYRQRVGEFILEIATDPSQVILKIAVIKIDEDDRVCQDDFEAGIYDLHRAMWRHGRTLGLPTNNYDIVSFAAALVEHAEHLSELMKHEG